MSGVVGARGWGGVGSWGRVWGHGGRGAGGQGVGGVVGVRGQRGGGVRGDWVVF